MSPEQRPSLDAQMAEAVRLQGEHIVASHAVDRRGWTRQQWVDDARKQMEDLHGSILDLVNGHVVYLLNEIDYLRHQLDCRAGISDSPAAAGSQPTTAGDSTLTDPLIVAVGVELAGRVWDPPLPKLPVGQWSDIVALIAKCVRDHDEGKRFIAEDTKFVRTFEGREGGECA